MRPESRNILLRLTRSLSAKIIENITDYLHMPQLACSSKLQSSLLDVVPSLQIPHAYNNGRELDDPGWFCPSPYGLLIDVGEAQHPVTQYSYG